MERDPCPANGRRDDGIDREFYCTYFSCVFVLDVLIKERSEKLYFELIVDRFLLNFILSVMFRF